MQNTSRALLRCGRTLAFARHEGATGVPDVHVPRPGHEASRISSFRRQGCGAVSLAEGTLNAKFHVRRPRSLLTCHLRPPRLSPGVSLRPSIVLSQAADFCHHGTLRNGRPPGPSFAEGRLWCRPAVRISPSLPRHPRARHLSAAARAPGVFLQERALGKHARGQERRVSPRRG